MDIPSLPHYPVHPEAGPSQRERLAEQDRRAPVRSDALAVGCVVALMLFAAFVYLMVWTAKVGGIIVGPWFA